MKQYTIYNPDNGQILRNLTCSDEYLEINMSENDTYIEGYYKSPEYIIKDGEAVKQTEDLTSRIKLRNYKHRSLLLQGSDWTQLPDSPLSSDKKTEYQTYRQALRDITIHSNWPNLEDSDWPLEPS